MSFNPSKLPREQLLADAFPEQEIHSDGEGWALVSCTHPECTHPHGDDPARGGTKSCYVNVESGAWRCESFGRRGTTWKSLVEAWWGADRWRELLRATQREELTLAERWAQLDPERSWTRTYGITPELSARYLRAGVRYPGDPRSDSVVALWQGEELRGIKWRLPAGALWKMGEVAKKDPRAKYALTKGSDSNVLLLAERLRPGAALLVCAGEKDALVAASHLDPDRWCPVTGCKGEGRVPAGLEGLARGRRVVIAYDGDAAGRAGAAKVARLLERVAESVAVAQLPTDTPPGAPKPGWDVAELVRHRGGAALLALLEDAGAPPPGEPPAAEGVPLEGGDPERESELDGWEERDGEVGRVVLRGAKDRKREVFLVRFRGIPRVLSVVTELAEDETQPGGWARKQEVTYGFDLAAGERLELRAEPGPYAFERLLEQHELASATHVVGRPDRQRLYLWTTARSQAAPRTTTYRAIGPHGDEGWLAPPGLRVRGGQLEETSYQLGPPSEEEEFRRYRLTTLSDSVRQRLAVWVTDKLLTCDHANGAYTLPALGAVAAAPLWHYLPLNGWQRYLVFFQGESGVGKTHLLRRFMCFWGDFSRPQKLSTWATTPAALEALLHHAVGVPVLVPDFKKANLGRDQYRAAMGLIQAYADRTSKGRSNRGRENEKKKDPRCTLLADGEDLPEGEQSTLGRMVIQHLDQHGSGLCAAATEKDLAPEALALLPGLTADWIAWVQLNAAALEQDLDEALALFEGGLPSTSRNRARLVRSYAIQHCATVGFLRYLEVVSGRSVDALCARAAEVHLAMARRQLRTVGGEAVGEQVWEALMGQLESGAVHLRPARDAASGSNPFHGGGPSSVCVGTFDRGEGLAQLWPVVLIPELQGRLTRGGGARVEASRRAIEQQLIESGLVTEATRPRQDGRRVYAWTVRLRDLGVSEAGMFEGAAEEEEEAA